MHTNTCLSGPHLAGRTALLPAECLFQPSEPGRYDQEIRIALKWKPKARSWTKRITENLVLSSQQPDATPGTYRKLAARPAWSSTYPKIEGTRQDPNGCSAWTRPQHHTQPDTRPMLSCDSLAPSSIQHWTRWQEFNLITVNAAINCNHATNSSSHLYLLFARIRDPKATTTTKMAQMASRRTANQRDVVRNKNQASGFGEA